MDKRRHQTIADFAAIAICPSLIVLLIASLVYFLVICLYQGGFSGRIGYIFFMFIVGAVGIARLSIQESRKYALGYAAVLGLATFFVISTFVQVQGPFAALSPIINAATIALIWFLADRITFDCTVIDEDQDASGQGLLDGLTDDKASGTDEAQHATRKRGRQPGRTVLWLTAAALPIFGIGQLLLPTDERWQRSAIFALGIYLFAALSLLVATSFLGVRRYLRQRGVDMPSNVSTAWLVGGIALTALMLCACFLLPQPGKMLANAEFPKAIQSPDWLKPSQYGWGTESASPDGNENAASSVPSQSPEQEAGESGGPDSQSEKSSGEAGGQKQGEKGEGGEKTGGTKKKDGEQKGQSEGKDNSEGKSANNEKPSNEKPGEKNAEKDSGEDSGDQSAESKPSESSEPKSEDAQNATPEQSQEPKPDESPKPDDSPKPAASQTPPPSEPLSARTRPSKPLKLPSLPSLGIVFKAIVYLALIGFLVFFAWTQRHEIAKAWQAFLAWLQGKSTSEEATQSLTTPQGESQPTVPFAAFRNPLGSAIDPREAIIVTYQATEAWWREHGQPRKSDETPFEFIRRLKRTSQKDQDAMVRLTEAYNRIVYGNDSARQPDLDAAAAVWKSFSRSI